MSKDKDEPVEYERARPTYLRRDDGTLMPVGTFKPVNRKETNEVEDDK